MSDVPRSKIFDDIYFSVEDGRAETKHVFLDGNDLPKRFQEKDEFVICETGFGTGLNFLMGWELFEQVCKKGKLHFISFEKYPLREEEIQNYLGGLIQKEFLSLFLNKYPSVSTGWHQIQLTGHVNLTLVLGDMNAEISKLETQIDAWFLDGFAPAKNPDMWSETLFENMARLSGKGTTLATFTAAGAVRRGLEAKGFQVEKVPGFGRKRDMIKGHYIG